ncbi:MAG: 30S ribosomal protein S8e [Candidatus Helarchaeales archaeon]
MVNWQGRSNRKPTGGRLKNRATRKKRKREMARPPIETIIGPEKLKLVRVQGGNYKLKVLQTEFVNVAIPKSNKTRRVKIKSLLSNPGNIDYERRKVITRGAIVETELGPVQITSRPGQHGQLNGILLEK